MPSRLYRRPRRPFLALVLFIFCLAPDSAGAAPAAKNIILLIADGCGAEQYTLARWMKGAPLAQDAILVGGVRTWIADSVVADSAPAGTAYAAGVRTDDKLIGLAPKREGRLPGVPDPGAHAMRPVTSILEAARLLGKSTGMVVTVRVTHATPAGFIAHVPHRDLERQVARQILHARPDVLLGGGRKHFLPAGRGGDRDDGLDLLDAFRRLGYHTPADRRELSRVRDGRALGLFAGGHLQPALDRPRFGPGEPTLDEMTAKALELLSKNPRGFFLMVEASQVDWACHINDPAHLVGELLAWDRAVAVALDFARRDGNTLLVAVSDHDTGGMSIGNRATNKSYPSMKPAALLDPIRRMRITAKALWASLEGNTGEAELRAAVKRQWGADLSEEDARRALAIAARYPADPEYGIGEVFSASHTLVGWTTHGHTGGDVPLYAFGPGKPSGLLDAPEVAHTMARAFGVDLRSLDARLHAEARSLFPGAALREERTSRGWTLSVSRAGRVARIEADTNLLAVGDETFELEGCAIRVEPTGKWYLPGQAAEIVSRGISGQ